MSKNEYTGFWVPAFVAANPSLTGPEKLVLARVASFKSGAFITNQNLADQLGLKQRWICKLILGLKKQGMLTSEPSHNGLRRLKITKKCREGGGPIGHGGTACRPRGGRPVGHPENTDRDYKGEYNHTCSSDDEQGMPEGTEDVLPVLGLLASQHALAGMAVGHSPNPQVTARPPSPLDDFDDDEIREAMAQAKASPFVAFPAKAAYGLLMKKREDRNRRRIHPRLTAPSRVHNIRVSV